MSINKADLEKELEKLLKELGLDSISQDEKKKITSTIADNILSNQYIDDVKDIKKNSLGQPHNPEIFNNVKLACMAEFGNSRSPKLIFDTNLLFKNRYVMTDEQKKDHKNELKKQMANLLKFWFELKYGPINDKAKDQIEKFVDRLINTALDKVDKNNTPFLGEDKKVNELLSALLDPARAFRMKFYNMDTPGGAGVVNQVAMDGNRTGAQDLDNNAASNTFAAEYNKADGQPDPVGIKILSFFAEVATGTLSEADENRMGIIDTINESPYASITPFKTTLTPGDK